MLRFTSALRIAVYLSIGIVGVVALILGEPLGWIALGISGVQFGLRTTAVTLRRRQDDLIAREAARRTEPGYVAPIVDPAEVRRRRTWYVKVSVFGVVAPCVAVAIVATWVALASTGALQILAGGFALGMALAAGSMIRGLRRGLKKISDNG